MKSVAIIGIGPAGIVTARKLLQTQQFELTIFEKADDVGGSWIPDSIINPEMRINQSKFTMCFSDLSWESGAKPVPLYPKALQVYQYLKAYCDRYIPPNIVRFETTVENVEQISEGHSQTNEPRWKLKLCGRLKGGAVETWEETFDYLVVAPGIFNIPKKPSLGSRREELVPMLHSTSYRTLADLGSGLSLTVSGKRRILVVGGSHSGGEISDMIAQQLSNAQYSPSSPEWDRGGWKNTEVVHVTSHELFGLPAIIRDPKSDSCAFQPLDLVLFDRGSRPLDPPPEFTVGLATPEKAAEARNLIRTILYGDEDTLDGRQVERYPPVAVLGDTYSQFLATGDIVQVRGALTGLKISDQNLSLKATIEDSNTKKATVIENVCAVIYATGFDTPASLSFLSEETKTVLGFDSSCPQAPIILDESFLSQNSSLRTFAMVGLTGAFWGLFEMQARAIAQAWTGNTSADATLTHASQRETLLQYYKDLRRVVKKRLKSEIPFNPFGDDVGALEQASRDLGLQRFDLGFSEAEGFVCSSRYLDPGADGSEAMATLGELQKIRKKARSEALFAARAVFLGLMGEWVAAKKDKSGHVSVIQMAFHPRQPTDRQFTWEYLAIARKKARSVYRYAETTDRLSIWTVKEDGHTTGDLVGIFDFNNTAQKRGKDTVVAVLLPSEESTGDIEGMDAYRFHFSGSTLNTWTMRMSGASAKSMNFVRVGKC